LNNSSIAANPEDIDIKQISLDILRDLYSASRKLVMYPLNHPAAIETINKPLGAMNEIFRHKKSFVLQTYNKRLVAEGLLLEDNIFVTGLFLDFSKHRIETIEFKSDLTSGDLYHFLKALVEAQNPMENYIQKFLKKQGISAILLNNKNAKTLYNFEDTGAGEKGSRYLLNTRIRQIIHDSPDSITAYYHVEAYFGIDFRLPILKKHMALAVLEMPEEMALEMFQKAIFSTNWLDESIDDSKLEGLRKLWIDYSVRSEDVSILLPVYNIFKSVGATDEILDRIFDRGALLKLKAVKDAEECIALLKSSRIKNIDFPGLRKTVFKLATENYSQQLEELLKQLLENIFSANQEIRQRGLRLAIEALQTLVDGSFWELNSLFIKAIVQIAHRPHSGNEIIELLSRLIENSAEHSRWEELKICCQTLRGIAADNSDPRRQKAINYLKELSESSVLNDILIDSVISGKGEKELFDALAALKSSMVAESLLNHIDCDDKAIRSRVIKSMVSMGRAMGPAVASRLAAIVGSGETTDEHAWYKLRNLLRIIGQIKYIEALPYLEVMAGWDQKRLKYEIIAACENMKSSAVGVILAKLAVDNDRDIRKSAAVAMGMTEHPDMVKFLKDIFYDPRSEKALIAESLGRIRSPQARDLLIDLYENEDIYPGLSISKKEEEQIKLAILKALSKIGDEISRSKIELYGSKKKGGLFKKDVLSATATLLLKNGQ
jgi:hypothetical protein